MKHLITIGILFCSLAAQSSWGQPLFSARVDYPGGVDPDGMFAADLDGDGDKDIVTANWSNNTVAVMLNNGNATFAAPVSYTTGAGAASVFSVDLDGDGDNDLATANQNGSSTSVLLNNGNATFAAKVDYSLGSQPFSVFSTDLDGDGDHDLAVTNTWSHSVSVWFNNGNGTFTGRTDYTVGNDPRPVFSADLDGDGDHDLITASQTSHTVSVLLNNGSGIFAAKVDYAVGSTPFSLYSADLDGDGDKDLATANNASGNTSVLLNNGDGTFATKVDYTTGVSAWSVSSADYNGDGFNDLAVANNTSNDVSVLLNNGDGTFALEQNYTVDTSPWLNVFSADLDGDGDEDLATANRYGGSISILLNQSDVIPPVVTSVNPASGPVAGGTVVAINGSSFQSGAGVDFGGIAATNVVVASSTTLTAITPAHPVGLVDVTATNPGGLNVTLTNGFEFEVSYAVTNTNDSGPGSLRQAIINSNATPGVDTITFDIPGPGPHTIQPLSALPWITDPAVIDGTSEPDFAGTPIIELDGSNAGAGANGLLLFAGSSTVKGLVINRFGFGLELSGSGGNVLEGNYIGTDVSGTVARGNQHGVAFSSSNNTLGGTTAAARNVISGNTVYGLIISGGTNNVVQGNYIGTDVSGTAALSNVGNGIRIQNAISGLIGGTAAGAGNLISGNGSSGIIIFSGSTNYQVQGNYIGTDASGTAALGNTSSGIQVHSASNITIGGTASGAGNLISGNSSFGVNIDGPGVRVEGNIIGADASGTAPLGNANSGVIVGSSTTIGGQVSNAGNLIAFNNQHGISVGGTGNAIESNDIHANGALGITLGVGVVTPNDVGDGDSGPNNLQNYPVLSTAFTSNSTISGSLNSAASTTFRLEFFANSTCDASGFGEGETFLSTTDVTTDGSGNVSFSVPLPGSVALGDFITATATDPNNNTSEFSQCMAVIEGSVTVSVPDTTATHNEALQIPVRVSDTSGQGIVSAEVFTSYDGDLLTALSVSTSNTLLTGNWSVETNIVEGAGTNIDTIKIAMATNNDVLVGAGTLINIDFLVADVRTPASSPLTLEHVLFNDGTPGHATVNGSVTLVGTDGTITSLPATIIPREDITVTVTDADEDRDSNSPDSFDVAVVNGAQTETLTLAETGNSTGIFTAAISTEFSLGAISGDAIVQAKAGDAIVSTYSDALDAAGNGPTDRSAQTDAIGGTDGAIRTTMVSQPGDLVRLRVTDADLNADPGNPESVVVTAVNNQTNESEALTLDEDGANSDIFFGTVATTLGTVAGTNDDGTFNTQKGDILDVTYDDVVTAQGGTASLTDDHEVVNPFGDADGNNAVQAFDAAKTLQHVLSPFLTGLDSLSANLDLLAFDPLQGKITPFDASLILQKRVGLIGLFPVQEDEADNHPQPETDNSVPKRVFDERLLSLQLNEGYMSVWADERAAIVSGEIVIQGIEGPVSMGEELSDFLSASRKTDDGLRIVFAGASPVSGPGELLRVYSRVGPDKVQLTRASFNDGRIAAQAPALALGLAAPAAFVLHANRPNPFNPETTIRFELPQESVVKLEVFDILGQKVKILVSGALPAGTHSAVWHGRNDLGAQVGNGVYLYRLETGDFARMRRMLLLK